MFELNTSESWRVSDPEIPTLAKALDPAVLGDYLPDVLPSDWGTIRSVRLQVLKHHPGMRCTFEIMLGTTRGCYSLIGKAYATDRSDVYHAMERIWRAGFGRDQEFSIPSPQGYLPELRLLLQEKVEGIRTKDVFLEGSDHDRVVAAERCARWLARFHTTAPKAGPVLEINKHLAILGRWSRHISEVCEPLGAKAARLFDQLAVAASRLSSVEKCAGHGSYNYSQIILADSLPLNGRSGRTITFDWDRYDVADPCRDVARFTVQLRRLARDQLDSIRSLDTYCEVFQRTYVAGRGPECMANLVFHQAAICLQFCEYLARRPTRQLEKIEAMLNEGLRILDQGAKPKMPSLGTRLPPEASDDPALSGLAMLCRPAELTATLSRQLAQWLGPNAHLLDSHAYLRHLSPGKRCSVELELVVGHANGVPSERRRLLGKLYRDDQGAAVYETLGELRRHGLGAGRFIVPEPLAYVPEYRVLLLIWAEGELLRSAFLARSDTTQEIAGAAEWLLGLHKCGVRTGRRYSFLGHLQTLAQWKELLAQVYPQGERLLGALLARFEERGRELSGWTAGPVHRDFSPEHLVVHGDQFTGLDFDEFCQYDPLFDVAHFTAHLCFLGLTHFGSLLHFDSLADRFLAAYKTGGGDYSEQRVSFYKAVAYFKLCRFVSLVQRPPEWMQILRELLSEARRLV